MSTTKKIRVGLVGIGNWGRYGHVPVLQLLPNFEINAVSSRRKEAAEETAREFGIRHALTDPNELITHPEVDLVVVLPPAPHHASVIDVAFINPARLNLNSQKSHAMLGERSPRFV
jgi:predicted dehydrogenase